MNPFHPTLGRGSSVVWRRPPYRIGTAYLCQNQVATDIYVCLNYAISKQRWRPAMCNGFIRSGQFMTSLLRRSIAFHYTSTCSLPPAAVATSSVREESRSRNNSKINVVPRFLKSPEGELRSMCTAPTIATTPPVTRATSCTREITQTTGESSAASVAGGKRALIRAGPESVYTAVRHDLTRK